MSTALRIDQFVGGIGFELQAAASHRIPECSDPATAPVRCWNHEHITAKAWATSWIDWSRLMLRQRDFQRRCAGRLVCKDSLNGGCQEDTTGQLVVVRVCLYLSSYSGNTPLCRHRIISGRAVAFRVPMLRSVSMSSHRLSRPLVCSLVGRAPRS